MRNLRELLPISTTPTNVFQHVSFGTTDGAAVYVLGNPYVMKSGETVSFTADCIAMTDSRVPVYFARITGVAVCNTNLVVEFNNTVVTDVIFSNNPLMTIEVTNDSASNNIDVLVGGATIEYLHVTTQFNMTNFF